MTCDRPECDRAARWLLQSNFSARKPSDPRTPDLEASYCYAHMVAALREHAEELLSTSEHIAITRIS